MFLLTVEDEGDFFFTVQGGLPENSLLEKVGNGEFRFSWNLQRVTNRPLIFVANDSLGASSIFVPNVEICACENGGICTSVNLPTITTTNVNIKKCSCNEGIYYIIIITVCLRDSYITQHLMEIFVKKIRMAVLRSSVLRGSSAWIYQLQVLALCVRSVQQDLQEMG